MKTLSNRKASTKEQWFSCSIALALFVFLIVQLHAQTAKPTPTPAQEGYTLTSEEQKDLQLAQKDQQIAAYAQELARQEYMMAQQQVRITSKGLDDAAEKIRTAHKWEKEKVQFDAQTLTFHKLETPAASPTPIAQK